MQILGGLWGFANKRDRIFSNILFSWMTKKDIAEAYNPKRTNKKGYDQYFLKNYFYKYALKNGTIHDSFYCQDLGGSAFPTQRPKEMCFIGCSDCCSSNFTKKVWIDVCPKECRPHEHKDWIYC